VKCSSGNPKHEETPVKAFKTPRGRMVWSGDANALATPHFPTSSRKSELTLAVLVVGMVVQLEMMVCWSGIARVQSVVVCFHLLVLLQNHTFSANALQANALITTPDNFIQFPRGPAMGILSVLQLTPFSNI
jgi:hypothetical protein